MNALARPTADYDETLSQSKIITQRVKCINRELAAHVATEEPVSMSARRRVCAALHHHLIVCEGMTSEQASKYRENTPDVSKLRGDGKAFGTPLFDKETGTFVMSGGKFSIPK
tara:strand:- start:25183 stop:25521 length:339 start_codon:yes stop_codon:yes gene_type:complete